MDKIIKNIHIRNFEARDAEVCFKIRSAAFIQKFHPEPGARATTAGANAFMPDKDTGVAEIPLIYVDLNPIGKQIGQAMMGYIEFLFGIANLISDTYEGKK
jgi:hypothetical protein